MGIKNRNIVLGRNRSWHHNTGKKNEEVWTKRTMINTLKPYENSGPLLESAVPTPLKDPWYY